MTEEELKTYYNHYKIESIFEWVNCKAYYVQGEGIFIVFPYKYKKLRKRGCIKNTVKRIK